MTARRKNFLVNDCLLELAIIIVQAYEQGRYWPIASNTECLLLGAHTGFAASLDEPRNTSPPRSPPATALVAAKSPRRRDFIWCGWSIDARAEGRVSFPRVRGA